MSLEEFKIKNDEYLQTSSARQYVFEITKQGGYSEWFSIFKDKSLSELYDDISYQFQEGSSILFVTNTNNTEFIIPYDKNTTCREFIVNNPSFFISVYPLPAFAVYKIYYIASITNNKE